MWPLFRKSMLISEEEMENRPKCGNCRYYQEKHQSATLGYVTEWCSAWNMATNKESYCSHRYERV